jgi:hypothetical protein
MNLPVGIQLADRRALVGGAGNSIRLAQRSWQKFARQRGWKMNCASKSNSANQNWTQIARQLTETGNARAAAEANMAATEKMLAEQRALQDKGVDRFARGVQGVERGRVETTSAGIS